MEDIYLNIADFIMKFYVIAEVPHITYIVCSLII